MIMVALSRVWNSISRIGIALILLLVVIPTGFCSSVWVYSLYLQQDLFERFPPPGTMVDIGSHRLHIYCTGNKGKATVVLEAGSGGWSTYWNRVHKMTPQEIRVCSYDRAGLGWSDKSPNPRDDGTIVAELELLLAESNESPPFVLVGHSAGGPLAWLFARNNPDQTAGVVMVDANTRYYREQAANEPTSSLRKFVRDNLRPLLVLTETTGAVLFPKESDTPAFQRNEYSDFQSRVVTDPGFRSRIVSSSNAERASFSDFGYMTSIGYTPLVVVEAGRVIWPISELEWRAAQKDLLAKSNNSAHIVAESVGHAIPRDGPEYIVKAIQHILGPQS